MGVEETINERGIVFLNIGFSGIPAFSGDAEVGKR
jgi:hypothetical protein